MAKADKSKTAASRRKAGRQAAPLRAIKGGKAAPAAKAAGSRGQSRALAKPAPARPTTRR